MASGRSQWEGQAADRLQNEKHWEGNFDDVNDGYVNSRIASTSEESESFWIGLDWRIVIIGRARYLLYNTMPSQKLRRYAMFHDLSMLCANR